MGINEDGTGTGSSQKIDTTNRAWTRTITENEQREATFCGEAFIVGSGLITLTNASQHAMLYLKNNEPRDLVIKAVNITSNKSTGGVECVAFMTVLKSATAMVGGTSSTSNNNNIASSITLAADITQGAMCATITGGSTLIATFVPIQTFHEIDTSLVLPKGSSIAFLITPPASNTSLKIAIALETYLRKDV